MSDQTTVKHLWDVDHPYYGAGDMDEKFDNWSDFLVEWSDADEDMNCLYRWDYIPADEDAERSTDEMHLHFILPRKSRCTEVVVKVEHSDEAAIIEYLVTKLDYIKRLWEPLA